MAMAMPIDDDMAEQAMEEPAAAPVPPMKQAAPPAPFAVAAIVKDEDTYQHVKPALVGKPGRITTGVVPVTARQIGLPGFRATPWARMPGGGNRLTTW